MRNRNLALRKSARNNKQALVESIMNKIAPIVKKTLNEDYDDDKSGTLTLSFNSIYNVVDDLRDIANAIEESDAYGGQTYYGDNWGIDID